MCARIRPTYSYTRIVCALVPLALAACDTEPLAPAETQRGIKKTPSARIIATTSITNLGALPGASGSYAEGINEQGVIVGFSGPPTRPVRWNGNAVITELGPTGANARAHDVNESGTAAGWALFQSGLELPVTWDVLGNLSVINLPNGGEGAAFAINDHGEVVGETHQGGIFRWSPAGGLAMIALPAGSSAEPSAINNSGDAVGWLWDQVNGHRAARWSRSGAITILDLLPGGSNHIAHDINDAGIVVGWARDAAGIYVAVTWSPSGAITVLPSLGNGGNCYALGINDRGEVVGYCGMQAFFWSQQSGIVDISGGLWYSEASAINNQGQIVGRARFGNTITAARWDISYINHAPSVSLAGSYAGVEGSPVTLVASASDPDGDPLTYTWDFGDGSGATGGPSVTHAFPDNRTYDVTVIVSDGQAQVSAYATVVVSNAPPTADAGQDRQLRQGRTMVLRVRASDPAGAADFPLTYSVDWGDGTSTAARLNAPGGLSLEHTYWTVGSRTINLTFTDNDGASTTDAVSVTVQPLPLGKPLAIDILPWIAVNSVKNHDPNVIRVAVMRTSMAPWMQATQVNPGTLWFGDYDGVVPVLTDPAKCGGPCIWNQDYNNDGIVDHIVTFDVSDLVRHDLSAAVTRTMQLFGFTNGGTWLQGQGLLEFKP